MKKIILGIFCLFYWIGVASAQPSAELVAEVESGYLLIKKNPQEELPPASLTKVMTLYLTFSALEKGWLKLEDKLPVSIHAASQPRTNLNLQAGQTITVKEAIISLIVHSANDAAVVLAEAMAPSEADFAQIMTQTASFLNMSHTTFKNASGLHEEGQKTTAQDMAILALAIIKHFPQYYPLFSTQSFDFNGKNYTSHNRILNEYEGAEGLKTGYVSAVGYNIISTAKKEDIRLVGVILGKKTSKERDKKMVQLLDKGFHKTLSQKEAVKQGRLNPAFDPLHKRAFLRKLDLNLFASIIKYQVKRAKEVAQLLGQKNIFNPTQSLFIQPSSSTWEIQIGAFSNKDSAVKIASKAIQRLGKFSPYISQNAKTKLYQTKLAGFSSQKEAFNACESLKKQDFPCFVLPFQEAQGSQ